MVDADFRNAAAYWFNRHQGGDLSSVDREAFDRWCEHPAARVAYGEVERGWALVGALAHDDATTAVRERVLRRYAWASRWRRYTGSVPAAAAAIAILFSVPAAMFGYLQVRERTTLTDDQIIATGPNQRATRTLADGSIVTVDAASQVRVMEMGAERRLTLLSGHAFFRVAKDPTRPFLVTAAGKTVHALGTAFDVRIAGEAVAVTLVEGKVRVDQPGSLLREPLSADMVPGHRLVAVANRSWSQAAVDPVQATAWLDDKLAYSPGSLVKVIADVNAGSSRKIVLVGPVDPDRKIIGVFNRGDVDAVVTVLEMNDVAHVVGRREDRIEMAMLPQKP